MLSPGSRMVGQAYTLRYLPAREDLDHNLVFDNSKDPSGWRSNRSDLATYW